MSHIIPVVIMTRNEGAYLLKCVQSIINTVTIPYHIYIIDNNSSILEQEEVLKIIEYKFNDKVNIIRNRTNRWVLGLNKTLIELSKNKEQPYFFLTDGDIDFSRCTAKPCWLSYLVTHMNSNVSLGKIGLSLNWDYISTTKELAAVYEQERSLYNENKKINDLYVSPVDTTAALFRWDWSIEGRPSLYPDHIRYLRPELYSCRTPLDINVEHMGWYKYCAESGDTKNLEEKIVCFTMVGGDVKNEILDKVRFFYKVIYKSLSGPVKKAWYFRRYYYLLKYFLFKGVRRFDGQNCL
ncbi:glycosyltransferase [Escherichia coli]|nr:glycosyltransferase [Escherichia coli]